MCVLPWDRMLPLLLPCAYKQCGGEAIGRMLESRIRADEAKRALAASCRSSAAAVHGPQPLSLAVAARRTKAAASSKASRASHELQQQPRQLWRNDEGHFEEGDKSNDSQDAANAETDNCTAHGASDLCVGASGPLPTIR